MIDLFEVILILSVVVVLPLASLKLILDYRRERMHHERTQSGAESALTVAELKDLMRDVAIEANEPVLRRIQELERLSMTDLSAMPEAEVEPKPERTMGRRVT